MLKIWGRKNSINVQKVILCVDAIGVAHERIDAGMGFGVVDTQEFRANNPNSLVPMIDDAGFILWESNAILRYLCAKFGGEAFYPADLRLRADLDRWMDWQQTTLGGPVNALFWGMVRKPGSRRPEELEQARARAEAAFALLDDMLAKRAYISGRSIGMADFAIAPTMHRWLNLPAVRPKFAAIGRYYEALMARPEAADTLVLPLT